MSVLKILSSFLFFGITLIAQAAEWHLVTSRIEGHPAFIKNNEYRITSTDKDKIVFLKPGTLLRTIETKNPRKGYTLIEDVVNKKKYFTTTYYLNLGTDSSDDVRTFNIRNLSDINTTLAQVGVSPTEDCNGKCSSSEETQSTPEDNSSVNEKQISKEQAFADQIALNKFRPIILEQFKIAFKEDGPRQAQLFEERVIEISKDKNTPLTVSDILHRTNGESNFNPTVINKSGHAGLYQFGKAAAKDLKTSYENIVEMTPVQQLDLFIKFAKLKNCYDYSSHVLPVTKKYDKNTVIGVLDVSKFHLVPENIQRRCTFTPKQFYTSNFVFDINSDGIITKEEINLYGSGSRRKKG